MHRDTLLARPAVCCGAPGIPAAGPSGASAHLRGIAEALDAVALVTPRHHDRRGIAEPLLGAAPVGTDIGVGRTRVRNTGVPGWPSWLGRWRDQVEVLAARRVADAVAELGPSLVWERHALFADVGLRVHAATRAPWILEVNAPPVLERTRWEHVRDPARAARWERDVVGAAPLVIAVSRWLAAWAQSLGAPNVRWIPNGARSHAGDRTRARAALRLEEDNLVLGFLGSARAWHGVERVADLLDALPHARALVVGEARVDHPRAHNVGVVPEAQVPDLVAAMDVGLAPYTEDAPPWLCPLKILHYRAQGVPVLATDVGDAAALVDAAAGIVVPRWTLTDAADSVRALARRGRIAPWVRTWRSVVDEALDALASPPTVVGTIPQNAPP